MAENTVYTVIVSDDEDELREAMCSLIPWDGLGFHLVGSASNGLDTLELVERFEPDLLLTDIRMPFISGIELARQVREVRPATNIAFISGYDDFEYAKQAISYNILSYMLKPVTVEGLSEELRIIHAKIDRQFELFRKAAADGAMSAKAAVIMPLVLDDYPDPEGEENALEQAWQCGILRDRRDRPFYTVMVSQLFDKGSSGTEPSFVASVNNLASKYLRGVHFYASGRVVSVLMGNPSDFEEYIHILADEISQMADRVLSMECRIGVSRETRKITSLHDAYKEAMEALRSGDWSESCVQFISDLAPEVNRGSILCRRALEKMEQNFMDPALSLVSISSMLSVSPNHLSACIKKYTGDTFINNLISMRMKAAKELLLNSSLKIQEVAERCGYSDQHYFSYCFKKYTGESPNSMRRRIHSEREEKP